MATRRDFLKLGAGSALLLGAFGIASRYVGRNGLDDRREVLLAMIPAVLDGALPSAPEPRAHAISAALAGVETTIAGLTPATQDELASLFLALAAAPSRLLLAGLAKPWREAGVDEVATVLQGWRTHRLTLLQGAYQALHKLILGAAYADEARWADIGYPGPPRF
ncbi:MAG: hypothetical protein LT106_19245 [Burkholderiaceae bacterium]|nr:hypothetical protein [Burkholderiaceae bacterium]